MDNVQKTNNGMVYYQLIWSGGHEAKLCSISNIMHKGDSKQNIRVFIDWRRKNIFVLYIWSGWVGVFTTVCAVLLLM
jgi:hypothetical protein